MAQETRQSSDPPVGEGEGNTTAARSYAATGLLKFCHECFHEFVEERESCEECGSDFIEIITGEDDPRDDVYGQDEPNIFEDSAGMRIERNADGLKCWVLLL